MPVKPLPRNLVKRLRKLAKQAHKKPNRVSIAVGRMENVDHRKDYGAHAGSRVFPDPIDTRRWGGRVRQMDIKRNYPGVELVIKRVHAATAQFVIDRIKQRVSSHKKKARRNDPYVLHKPFAYAIDEYHLAMAKTDFPSLTEILSRLERPDLESKTSRGQAFFSELQERNPRLKETITIEKLEEAFLRLKERGNFARGNILLIGFKKGKFQFMPLLDVF